MNTIRLALALALTSLGCSAADLDSGHAADALHNGGYGYEFLPDRVGAAPDAAVPASVPGRLMPEPLRDTLRARSAALRACAGGRAGEVTVRFTIQPDGAVPGATVEKDGLRDAAAAKCVADAVATTRFPTSGDGMVTVVYPLQF